MKNVFAARPEILARVRAAGRILLFLDYDGTLVPIRPTPELAKLSPERKKLLAVLARLPRFRVGVLTGRSMNDIRRAVGISGFFYAANYGLRIETQKKSWLQPEANKQARLLRRMLSQIKQLEDEFPGVRIEDKTLTVAVHYRQYKGQPLRLKKKLVEIIRTWPGRFRLKTGKRIFEVYPAVQWDKGKALLKVEQMMGFRKKPLVIFIGDDRADEEAFRQMDSGGISVAVGRRQKSAARYFCRNSSEVTRFLEFLLKAKTAG